MISEAIINLSIVGAICLLLMIYLIRFVFRYKHEYESNPLCTSAVVFCLFIVLLTVFVLPVDIFLVSFVKEPDGTFKDWATNDTLQIIDKTVSATYYSLYGIITFLIFVVIPFLHFFNEESESNSSDRLHSSIKYTSVSVLLMFMLLLVGVLLHQEVDPNDIFSNIISFTKATKFQGALNLVMALITTAGFLNVTFYTASGIFSWPISLILGTSSVSNRFTIMNDREIILRMRISNLKEKARLTQLTSQEATELAEAENDLVELEREEAALSDYRGSITYKLRGAIRPIQIVFGVALCLEAIFLVVTLLLVNIDRLLHSNGLKQGYILIKPQIFNPLDYVYTQLQGLLFIGPLPLLMVTSFLVVATISGIRNLGLWFLFARIYRIKVGRTQPQALLFFCITIMLAALSFNLTLYSMTTQYITFGNQNFRSPGANGTYEVKPCTLDNYRSECIVSRSSSFLMRMMSQIWIFGAVFYWWSYTFIVVASISFLAYLIRGKRSASHELITNDDEFED